MHCIPQLGPAIISFAFSTHAALKTYPVAVHVLGIALIVCIISYFVAAAWGRVLQLPLRLRLSSIFHSVSPAVAITAQDLLQVDGQKCIPSVVAASAICSGITAQFTYGILLSPPIVGSKKPVVRGATVGVVGLVLGAVPMKENGEMEAFGIAALAYIGMAIWGGVLLLIPPLVTAILGTL